MNQKNAKKLRKLIRKEAQFWENWVLGRWLGFLRPKPRWIPLRLWRWFLFRYVFNFNPEAIQHAARQLVEKRAGKSKIKN
jgi:hypothetical protein